MKHIIFSISVVLFACSAFAQQNQIFPGAVMLGEYILKLKGKNVGVVVNQSSKIYDDHLIDVLLAKQIAVKKIFAPEHGFRGNADRGATIKNGKDVQTGLPIVSLYGKNKKPSPSQLKGIDVLVFDIQDVGVRFFTYISTMHYAMEAAAENGIEFMVLDRPNPLGDYVDGPVRKKGFKSFVGMHPIPVVHGLTVGELAKMIKGERWINHAEKLNLSIIPCKGYSHKSHYELPIKPSPNLPNMAAIRLYPSLCFFEATEISVGRGTNKPFQQVGYPDSIFGKHTFIPQDMPGMQMNPVQENMVCYGIDLSAVDPWKTKFSLEFLMFFYKNWKAEALFWKRANWFNLLAGNDQLIDQLEKGMSEKNIRRTWQKDLKAYKAMRKKYLLYDDFE